MADDTNDMGARVTLALVAPVKVGKKAANKRSDKAPIEIKVYADAASVFKAVDEVSKGMISLDDSSRSLLRLAALQFSVLKPVDGIIWEQTFKAEMAKRYQNKTKLSYVKTALIAFSNCEDTEAAIALCGEHTSLQGFVTAVRPSLVAAGLVKAATGGKPQGHTTDKAAKHSETSNVVHLNTKTDTVAMQTEFKNMARAEAAAVLANHSNEPHTLNKRLQALLIFATSTEERSIELMDMLLDMYPDRDTLERVEMVDLED